MIGRTLEHYRIDSKLGEGGMGVVYKAYDSRLNRAVAIKVLRPESVNAAASERFLHEARAASALNHPAIVTIHDIRAADGVDFIVMEYVAGRTLDRIIRESGLSPDETLRYAVEIADALSKAHAAGILHRDLKPSNVMVTGDRRVKLLDFGLAKLLEAPSASDATTWASPVTAEHLVVGTAAYMSPEQAEGRTLDARSDIFSFGAVLYEMATGEQAFTGASWLTLLNAVVRDDPTGPRTIAPAISPEFERLILRCLRKDPARRYQTMADLKVALDDLQLETTSGQLASRGRGLTIWVGAALILLAVAAGYIGWRQLASAPPAAPLRADALTTFPGKELYPSLSRDGNYVAFTWSGPKQDNTDVYVQQIGAGTPLRLTSDPRDEYNPVWSPDGRWIAFLRGAPEAPLGRSTREVRLVPPLGGPERALGEIHVQEITENQVYLAWCPDSSCVIVTDTMGAGKPDALVAMSIETGAKRPLTNPQPPALADTNPAISSDGRRLLFIRRRTWALGELQVVALGNGMITEGEPKPVPAPGINPDTPTWLNADEILVSTPVFAGGAALWRVSVSGAAPPARLPFVGEDGTLPTVFPPQDNRSGRLVYVRSFTDENIWSIAAPNLGETVSTSPAVAIASTKPDMHPQLSPDGRRVAFTSTRSGAWEIWVCDPDGSNPVQVTSLRAPTGTGAPTWSPDGRSLVFASDAEGQFDIFVVPAAGGKPRNITSHPAFEHVPVFSHDGKSIYFSSTRTGSAQLWKVAVDGGAAEQVTRDGGWLPRAAPDGTALYFTPTPGIGLATSLWRIPTSGGSPVKVLDGVANMPIVIVPHGIYYFQPSPEGLTVQFYDLARQRSTVIAGGLAQVLPVGGFSVSMNGRILMYTRMDSAVDDLMLVEGFR